MSPPNSVLSTIIFVLALQAIFLSVLLLIKRPRKSSHLFLAMIVFFFALMSLNIALINVLIHYERFEVFRYVQLELMFGIGPALYFYTRSITESKFKFSRQDYLHFVPVILEFIFYRTSFYRLGADGMYQFPYHPYTSVYLTEQFLGVISISIYCGLSLWRLYRHESWLKQHYSNLEQRSLKNLKLPIITYSVFWIGWNTLTEIDRFVFERALRDLYFLPTFVGLAAVTCWIGFQGYLRSYQEVTLPKPVKDKPKPRAVDAEAVKKIRAGMKNQQAYLDPDLSLSKLSERLDMNPKLISHTLNQSFSMNFYEYVNHYRVEAFKKRIQEPGSEKLTLLAHAYDCGFKSKSTFNHVFKKSTGKTPSEYLKSLKN